MKESEFVRLNESSREEFLTYYIMAHYSGVLQVQKIKELVDERGRNFIKFAEQIGAITNS